MATTYRSFQAADSSTVSEMMLNLSREDFNGTVVSEKNIRATFEALNGHPDLGIIMLIEENAVIIGYSILINFWSNEYGGNIVHIDEIYIKNDFRGRGIGSSFIKYLVKNKFANAVGFQLEVTPKNEKAKELYEKLGFKLHKNNHLFLEL